MFTRTDSFRRLASHSIKQTVLHKSGKIPNVKKGCRFLNRVVSRIYHNFTNYSLLVEEQGNTAHHLRKSGCYCQIHGHLEAFLRMKKHRCLRKLWAGSLGPPHVFPSLAAATREGAESQLPLEHGEVTGCPPAPGTAITGEPGQQASEHLGQKLTY